MCLPTLSKINLRFHAFQGMMQYDLLSGSQHFEGMLENIQPTTHYHIPEHLSYHNTAMKTSNLTYQ